MITLISSKKLGVCYNMRNTVLKVISSKIINYLVLKGKTKQICCKHISFLEKEKVLNAILGLKISNYLIFVGKRFMNFRKDLHNTFFFTRLIYQLPLIRVVSTNDSNLQKWQNCRRLLNFQLGLPNLKLIVGHI